MDSLGCRGCVRVPARPLHANQGAAAAAAGSRAPPPSEDPEPHAGRRGRRTRAHRAGRTVNAKAGSPSAPTPPSGGFHGAARAPEREEAARPRAPRREESDPHLAVPGTDGRAAAAPRGSAWRAAPGTGPMVLSPAVGGSGVRAPEPAPAGGRPRGGQARGPPRGPRSILDKEKQKAADGCPEPAPPLPPRPASRSSSPWSGTKASGRPSLGSGRRPTRVPPGRTPSRASPSRREAGRFSFCLFLSGKLRSGALCPLNDVERKLRRI